MKIMNIRILMIAAMVVAILTACSSNEAIDPSRNELEDVLIDFSSETNKATRTTITTNKDLADAGGFYVWGWKAPTPSSPENDGQVGADVNWSTSTNTAIYQVFQKQNVTSNTGDGAYQVGTATNWTYSPKKYWDRRANYIFYAAGPAGKEGRAAAADIELVFPEGSTNINEQLFQINGVPSLSSKDPLCNDFIIDRDIYEKIGKEDYNKNVDFTFHHIMSKVVVKLKAGVPDCTITVTDLKATGWDNAKYDFLQERPTVPKEANKDEWKLPEGSVSNKAGLAVFLDSTAGDEGISFSSDSEDAVVPTSYIMVPQEVSGLTFTVSYKITYSDGITDTFKNVEGTLTNQKWYTDCLNIYTLTISPQPIKFNVSSVGWTGNSDATIIVQ